MKTKSYEEISSTSLKENTCSGINFLELDDFSSQYAILQEIGKVVFCHPNFFNLLI